MNEKPPRQSYKAELWDYDYLLEKTDDECSYCLSEREVQILLAQIDYIGWKTRYKPTSTEIDLSVILQWQGNLTRKLMSGCCGDDEAIHQYLPDGTYQSSEDDGETWEDDPTGDPRHAAVLAPPLVGTPGDALRCAAADNVRDQYLVMRDNTIALLTAGTTVLAIVAGLVALIGGILAISVVGISFGVILFGLAAALLSLTPESVEEQIDAEALETFKCIVYCHMDNAGRILTGEFDDILNDITVFFGGFPESFFYSITASMGATGLNNAATMGTNTADDCEECDCDADWCYRLDFTASDFGWVADFGAWESGTGWTGVPFGTGGGLSNLNTTYTPALNCTSIKVHSIGSGFTVGQREIWITLGADPTQHHVLSPLVNGDQTGQYNQLDFSPFQFNHIELYWGGAGSSDILIDWVEFHGVGVNPFGDDNCI